MGSPVPSIDSINDQHEYQSLSSAHSPLTASPTSLSSHGSGGIGNGIHGLSNGVFRVDNFMCNDKNFSTFCDICHETFTNPKVLPCLHTFCKSCLERSQKYPGKVTCARCNQDCILSSNGVTALLPDFTALPDTPATIDIDPATICTNCKNAGSFSTSYCYDCHHSFCHECTMAHQLVNFEGHRVYSISLDSMETKDGLISGEKKLSCSRHKTDDLKYFCLTCNVPICKQCTILDHTSGLHDFELISEIGHSQVELITQMAEESKMKAGELKGLIKTLNHAAGKLQVQYHKAQNEVNDTFLFYRSMLEERKQDILKELESVFSNKQLAINVVGQKANETVEKIFQTCDFVDRLFKRASISECMVFKKLLDTKLQGLISYDPEINIESTSDLEFISNFQAIQVGVRNTFGYIKLNGEPYEPGKQPPIARPNGAANGTFMMNGNGAIGEYFNGLSHQSNGLSHHSTNGLLHHSTNGLSHHSTNGLIHHSTNGLNGNLLNGSMNGSLNGGSLNGSINGLLDKPYTNGLDLNGIGHQNGYETDMLSKRFTEVNGCNFGPFGNTISDLNLNDSINGSMNGINTIGGTYEKWSNGGGDIFQNGSSNDFSMLPNGDAVLDLTTRLLTTNMFPPKSQIKRQKMIYHCKFGEFGAMESQFTEPSGVAVNAQNDIIVADTNNHRIQIFDKDGRYKFQFGECGKRDGQLLYPNRVAVIKHSGDIIVTERSPTHQIQIYNQYGQFVRKFGATILQHPRGITVDNKGRIIVVECKVMRVIIFDQVGNVLQKFGCSKHLEFPNGVVVNERHEIFISDNRAHCVKVFNYEGTFLRQIGNEGITNYPIGVGINAAGEILIADNHNNFNLTIFTQDGQLVSALESKVKHAQCFDVALMDDGSVVLASKDYRLYIYRYLQIPPVGI